MRILSYSDRYAAALADLKRPNGLRRDRPRRAAAIGWPFRTFASLRRHGFLESKVDLPPGGTATIPSVHARLCNAR